MKKDVLRNIKQCAEKARVEVERVIQGGKHIKVQVKGNKSGVVFVSLSASDHRAFQNVVTDMKKAGYSHG